MQNLLTNEEKRVSVYQSTKKPTDPKTVTPDTPLEELNLNWREADLPERERTKHVHRLHPYLGKFIPQLVEIFLRKYFQPGQTVLDPFCGSGTTLVQANELGINSVGYDISSFNILLCRAKTTKYDIKKMRMEVLDILRRTEAEIKKIYGNQQLVLWEEEKPALTFETNDDYLLNWYAPRALTELLIYRYFIKDYEYQDLLKIILSRSARSARLTTHYDLDFPKKPQREPYWCYKHSRICQPTTEAFKFLYRYSYDTISRIEEFDRIRTDAKIEIFHEDSRTASFPPVHGVITSPPYVGLIDYHEQHAYAYHLLGLEDRREDEIGAAFKGDSQKAKEEYRKDITEVFRRVNESLLPGGRVIVVAADTANLYESIAEQAGFKVEGIVNRHVNRRTGRRSSEFFESVFIWRKD
ncbi:MAG: DNA methyltransferase [Thermacetogeniaceae bacterium]